MRVADARASMPDATIRDVDAWKWPNRATNRTSTAVLVLWVDCPLLVSRTANLEREIWES